MTTVAHGPPQASAISTLISQYDARSASEALPIEVLHNLQYQHHWTDLQRHLVCVGDNNASSTDAPPLATLMDLDAGPDGHGRASPLHSPSTSGTSTPITAGPPVVLISGRPPRHAYIHPDLQIQLLRHAIAEASLPVQREFVLPLALGGKRTLGQFCQVFDALPEREILRVQTGAGNATGPSARRGPGNGDVTSHPSSGSSGLYDHHDSKRILLGMRAREGGGGDGTIVYYIMHEGEVKPRQNG